MEHVGGEETRPPGLTWSGTHQSDRPVRVVAGKATELGVEEVIPVWTQRSERRVESTTAGAGGVAATKQTTARGCLVAPACNLDQVFDAHPQLTRRAGAVAHCMTACDNTPERIAWPLWQAGQNHAWIAIGPEGDFTTEEVQWLAARSATPVHLGG